MNRRWQEYRLRVLGHSCQIRLFSPGDERKRIVWGGFGIDAFTQMILKDSKGSRQNALQRMRQPGILGETVTVQDLDLAQKRIQGILGIRRCPVVHKKQGYHHPGRMSSKK